MIFLVTLLISNIFAVEGLEPLKITTEDVVYAEEGSKLQLPCLINRPFLNITIEWKRGPNLQNASCLVQSHYGVVGGPYFRRGYDLLQNGSLLIERYTEDLQDIYYCKVRDAVGDEAYNSTNLATNVKFLNPRLEINFCEDFDQNCTKYFPKNSELELLCWTSSEGPAINLTWNSNVTDSLGEFHFSWEIVNGTSISTAFLTVVVIDDAQYVCTAYSDDFHFVNAASSFINISPVKNYSLVTNYTVYPVTPQEKRTTCTFPPFLWPFIVTPVLCITSLGSTIALIGVGIYLRRMKKKKYVPVYISEPGFPPEIEDEYEQYFDISAQYQGTSGHGYEDPGKTIELKAIYAVTVEVKKGSNLILPCTKVKDGVVWKTSNKRTNPRLICIDCERHQLGTEDFHTIDGNLFINGFEEKHEGIYYTGDLDSLKSEVHSGIFYVYCGTSHDMVFRVRPGSTVYFPFNEYDESKGGCWMKLAHGHSHPEQISIDGQRFEILENGNLIINNVTEEDSGSYSSSFSQYECTSTFALSVEPQDEDFLPEPQVANEEETNTM